MKKLNEQLNDIDLEIETMLTEPTSTAPITILNGDFFTAGQTLAECEADIEKVEELSRAVKGERLHRIKKKKLYKKLYQSWEHYCKERWNWTPQHANNMIKFAETYNLIAKSETMVSLLPESERQTRPLNGLSHKQKIEVWEKAIEIAENGQPTAAEVKAAAKQTLTCDNCKKPTEKLLPENWPEGRQNDPKFCLGCFPTQTLHCPKCGNKQKIYAEQAFKDWYVTCKGCGKEAKSSLWIVKPKADRYCPTCGNHILIPPEELEKGKITKCQCCQKTTNANSFLTKEQMEEQRRRGIEEENKEKAHQKERELLLEEWITIGRIMDNEQLKIYIEIIKKRSNQDE